jgi:anti-sigma factor RsiW
VTCPHMEVKLNEYVDGTLAARDQSDVEAHLTGCAGCRAAVAELRSLSAAAASLPKSIEPGRDLWAAIEARIRQRAPWNVQRAWWRGALAAAAVLVLAVGIYRLLPPFAAHDRPVGQGWAAVQADFDRASDELGRILALERQRLAPQTVALVERNLAIIDAAVAESRAALARDPANADLRRLFAAAARQKVELLRWAARVAASRT